MGPGPTAAMMGSRMLRSTTWPVPSPASRWYSAIIVADDAAIAQIESASPKAGSVGGASAGPVRWAKPLMASASVPNPGRDAYGPSWPKPEIRTSTSPGFASCSTSGPSPHRSSVPGRKFSTSTSASAASRRSTSAPRSSPMLMPTVRLLRDSSFHHNGTPSLAAPWPRIPSPFWGCSTLMTSAPKSPRIWQHSGPARIVDTSSTRSPASGPVGGREVASAASIHPPGRRGEAGCHGREHASRSGWARQAVGSCACLAAAKGQGILDRIAAWGRGRWRDTVCSCGGNGCGCPRHARPRAMRLPHDHMWTRSPYRPAARCSRWGNTWP